MHLPVVPRLVLACLVVAVLLFGLGTASIVATCTAPDTECSVLRGSGGMAVAAAAVGAFALALSLLTGRARSRGALVVVVAVMFVAATPVSVAWKACNTHGADMAAGLAVVTLVVQPEDDLPLAFHHLATLMDCLPAEG